MGDTTRGAGVEDRDRRTEYDESSAADAAREFGNGVSETAGHERRQAGY